MSEFHPVGDLASTTLQKIKEMFDANTTVGAPIQTPDGVTLIPVSQVSVGFATGGSDFSAKSRADGHANFGGGSGAAVKVEPVAFLIVSDGAVRLLPVGAPAVSTVDRIVDMAPQVIDQVTTFLDKRKAEKDLKNTSAQ